MSHPQIFLADVGLCAANLFFFNITRRPACMFLADMCCTAPIALAVIG